METYNFWESLFEPDPGNWPEIPIPPFEKLDPTRVITEAVEDLLQRSLTPSNFADNISRAMRNGAAVSLFGDFAADFLREFQLQLILRTATQQEITTEMLQAQDLQCLLDPNVVSPCAGTGRSPAEQIPEAFQNLYDRWNERWTNALNQHPITAGLATNRAFIRAWATVCVNYFNEVESVFINNVICSKPTECERERVPCTKRRCVEFEIEQVPGEEQIGGQ